MVLSTKSSVTFHWLMEKTILKRRLVFAVFILCFLLTACSKGKTVMDSVALDVQTLPLMHSEVVSSLISDFGVTRYRLAAKVWDVYDSPQPQDSYWYFPKGIYVEKFDSVFEVEGSIESDTAYYYDKKSLWHLIGNVKAMNLQKEKFETQEMFWDEKLQKIYSDQLIRIEKVDSTVVWGKGFESDQFLTNYHIFKTYGIFYVSDNDSIP